LQSEAFPKATRRPANRAPLFPLGWRDSPSLETRTRSPTGRKSGVVAGIQGKMLLDQSLENSMVHLASTGVIDPERDLSYSARPPPRECSSRFLLQHSERSEPPCSKTPGIEMPIPPIRVGALALTGRSALRVLATAWSGGDRGREVGPGCRDGLPGMNWIGRRTGRARRRLMPAAKSGAKRTA